MKNAETLPNRAPGAGCPRWALLLSLGVLGAANPTQPGEPDVRRDPVVAAVDKVMPSVVNIATATIVEYHDFYEDLLRQFYQWGPAPRREQLNNLGSGVILDEEGHILTNFHVVRRASRVQVKLWDGREYDADRLVATPGSDVALLKIRAQPGEKFTAIQFAQDDDLLLGETVVAVGNPFGLGGSVSRGILSSKNRRPPVDTQPLDYADWLQTDAAINPGNSGGPLVNLRGELIGLNVAMHPEGRGIGFAIPVKQVSASLSSFFRPEVTDSLWFGAKLRAGPYPLTLAEVCPDGPAEQAGLRSGDRVLQVNGTNVSSLMDCSRRLGEARDRRTTLLVLRNGERHTHKVQLLPLDEVTKRKLGFTLQELTPQTAARLGIRSVEGMLVGEVEKGGPAAGAGLERGVLVTAVDGQTSAALLAVVEVLADKRRGDKTRLTVVVPRPMGGGFVGYRQGTVELTVR